MFRWVTGGYERFISFSEFKGNFNTDIDTSQVFDTRTETDILADVSGILNELNNG